MDFLGKGEAQMIHCKPVRRVFYDSSNGYTIASYITKEELPQQVVRQNKDTEGSFTAVGIELPVSKKLELELDGDWIITNNGLRFEVSCYYVNVPETKEGIEAYLSSDLVKGIGPVTAGRIVDRFGKSTFYVMNNTPEKLLDIPGISETRLEEILDGYHKSISIRELMVYMAPLGVTPRKLMKIQEHFGDAALKIVKENPYRLCEINGMGFLTVDPIAVRAQNFKPENPLRIKAAIAYVLQRAAEDDGHLYLTSEEVVDKASQLLNHRVSKETVKRNSIKDAGNDMIRKDHLLIGNAGGIYTKHNFEAEMGAAAALIKLILQKDMYIKVDHLLTRVQNEIGIVLNKEQKEAVCNAFASPVSIITGGPGRGKTTIIQVIIHIQEILDKEALILLCAPTGRARRKMYESTHYPAITIQKGVGMTGQNEDGEWSMPESMPDDLIIADEMSMVDMYLAYRFFNSIKDGARLVLVGDINQLESVGPGNVFKEMIESGVIPVTELMTCFRQEEDGTIAGNADKINSNRTDLIYDETFQFLPANNPEDAASIIKKIYEQKWRSYGKNTDSVQVLSPLRKETAAGSDALNELLREVVNPKRRGKQEALNGKTLFREGDKVMQTQNNDEVSNGDMGSVINILKEDDVEKIRVDFGDGRIVEYADDRFWPLAHAYAISIHKSQGSAYPIVIIPMLKSFNRMLRRNILYTAVTRAGKEVILVGNKTAIAQAIHNNKTSKRNTNFGLRLRKLMYEALKENKKSA